MPTILLYMDYKNERFYIDDIEKIMDIYEKYNLDKSTYIHKSIQNVTSVYFICKKDQLHTIYFQNKKMEIPLHMNVCEFQIYVNSFQVIYHEKNNCFIHKLLYYSDDTFTTNNHYSSPEL